MSRLDLMQGKPLCHIRQKTLSQSSLMKTFRTSLCFIATLSGRGWLTQISGHQSRSRWCRIRKVLALADCTSRSPMDADTFQDTALVFLRHRRKTYSRSCRQVTIDFWLPDAVSLTQLLMLPLRRLSFISAA